MNNEEIDKKLDELKQEGNINIDSIENLMVISVNQYREQLARHIEEVLLEKVDENEIIIKKTRMERKRI